MGHVFRSREFPLMMGIAPGLRSGIGVIRGKPSWTVVPVRWGKMPIASIASRPRLRWAYKKVKAFVDTV